VPVVSADRPALGYYLSLDPEQLAEAARRERVDRARSKSEGIVAGGMAPRDTYALEAERAVAASVVVYRRAWCNVAGIVDLRDFSLSSCREVIAVASQVGECSLRIPPPEHWGSGWWMQLTAREIAVVQLGVDPAVVRSLWHSAASERPVAFALRVHAAAERRRTAHALERALEEVHDGVEIDLVLEHLKEVA
jgi:hypothetical protein